MADVLATVQKLISLTDSPFEEEARTAAIKAVRLIRDNNLLHSQPKASPVEPQILRSYANIYVEELVSHLQTQARTAVYPFYTAKSIANDMVLNYDIPEGSYETLVSCLKRCLKQKVDSGVMEYKPGKGYRLVYKFVWDIVS